MFGCSQSLNLQQEEEAIRGLRIELSEALADKDWEHYSSLWVQDSTLQVIHPETRGWIEGWDSFKEQYQPLLASDVNIDFELKRFDSTVGPNGDIAWATIDNIVLINGQAQPTWQVAVFRKVANQWRINLGFSASVAPLDQSEK